MIRLYILIEPYYDIAKNSIIHILLILILTNKFKPVVENF